MSYSNVFSTRKLKKAIIYFMTQTKNYEYEILIGVCTFLLTYFILNFYRRKMRNYPPGPRGLPFVGYLPFLTANVHLDFMELGKKYGSVFSVKLGSKNFVILHDAKVIKEALARPEFLKRPSQTMFSKMTEYSVFFVNEHNVWMEQRKFVFQSLKELGFGKSTIDDEIQNEISLFLDYLKDKNGVPLDPKETLSPSMSNNICALVFGKRYDFKDPIRKALDSNLEKIGEAFSQTSFATFFPEILSIPFLKSLFQLETSSYVAYEDVVNICKQEVQRHKETFDPNHIRDFIDSYLIEMKSKKEKNEETTFSDHSLTAIVTDLFGAGSETVRISILWCIYITAAYPEVQKKIQNEIQDVVGSERSPQFSDQKRMPYTHATILEIMRWKTIVPLNIARCTSVDTTLAGYTIPKDTIVLANFWAVHYNPKLWDEPHIFKPERFLKQDESSVIKSSNFMPFSLGKRACPGETMANMETFLYFTSILQKFDIVFPEGVKPTFRAKMTVAYRLEPYKVRFILRSA